MEYFRMDDEKLETVARLVGMADDMDAVREYCLADWPEGEAHQRWLDNAPVSEIASWVRSGLIWRL